MKKIIAILLLCLNSPCFANNKPKILVSIPPVASLVKMAVGDLADVEIIQKSSTCPHHSHIKPSEVFAIKNADYIVFIDEKFESSLAKYTKDSKAYKINISNFEKLRLENNNFHIWVDLSNAKIILFNIKEIMTKNGFNKKALEVNYEMAIKKINDIGPLKEKTESMFIGESLYYLYPKGKMDYFEISTNPSVKRLLELKEHTKKHKKLCIFHDETIKQNTIRNFYEGKIIQIDVENWHTNTNLTNLYLNYIKEIYIKLDLC